jgi:putative copper resistance protein D
VALGLLIAHGLVEPVRLTGNFSAMFDRSLQALLLASDFGTTLAVRALGLVIIVGSTRKQATASTGIALIGTMLIAASFAFMGHTAADPQRWLLAPLLCVHLIAVAFWFGSLWPLLTVTRLETAAVAGAVIERFSRTALGGVPVILLAGLAMAGLLLPGLASLGTPYGLALLAKLGGFAQLLGLADLNKWRLAPGIALGNPKLVAAFRFSVVAEWVLMVAVITVTAAMTALFSPDH